MNAAVLAMLRLLLSYKLERVAHLPASHWPKKPLPADRIKIATVQWQADPVGRVEDWISRVDRVFSQAQAANAHLLVFPEYMPLPLLGAVMPAQHSTATLSDESIASLLGSLAPPLYRFWRRWMAQFARRYHLTTVAGSCITVENGQLLNVALTFDQDGVECMHQPKWHILPAERNWGVASGADQLEAPYGPLSMATWVCNDATYFESFRISEAQGAHIVVVPIADPEARFTEGKARRGCFSRVQDVPMIGVVSAMTGNLFGLRLTGKAGIYLPRELTADLSGVVVESPLPVGEGVMMGVVSLKELEAYRVSHKTRYPVPNADFMDALYHLEED